MNATQMRFRYYRNGFLLSIILVVLAWVIPDTLVGFFFSYSYDDVLEIDIEERFAKINSDYRFMMALIFLIYFLSIAMIYRNYRRNGTPLHNLGSEFGFAINLCWLIPFHVGGFWFVWYETHLFLLEYPNLNDGIFILFWILLGFWAWYYLRVPFLICQDGLRIRHSFIPWDSIECYAWYEKNDRKFICKRNDKIWFFNILAFQFRDDVLSTAKAAITEHTDTDGD